MVARLSPFIFIPGPPVQRPFSQKDWLLTTTSIYQPINLRTWTWQYNPNLIGQDVFPPGRSSTALPPYGPEYRSSVINWVAWYNLNLIGKDRLPTGEQVYDLPARPAEVYPYRNWTWSYNLNLIGQDKLPVGEQVTDLPPRAPLQPIPIHTASYNLNLIGQDIVPGKRFYDLPPQPPILLQTWVLPSNIALFTTIQNPFAQYDWPVPKGPQQPDRFWSYSYNLNLIGQDQLPPGEQRTDRPLWPFETGQYRSWTASYNLNLIGLDKLPTGKQVTDLVPRPFELAQYRSWTYSYNLNLIGKDVLPTGKALTDLPPRPYELGQYRSWTASYNLNLIGQDKLPVGKQVTDLPPRAPQQPIPIMAASYNKNLIGQDVLPPGSKLSDLPPRDYDRAVQLRTWIQSVNVALTVQAAQVPFNQYDWPVPKGPQPLLQTWTSSFNLNLIGKDKLPNRQQDWPNPTQPYRMPQSWASSYNPNLIGKDKLPFRQMDWPVPRAPEYPINLRTSIFYPQITPPPSRLPFNQYDWPLPQVAAQPDRTYTFTSQFLTPFVPPPTPELPNIERPYVRDWWDRDEWGTFYPGSGIRRG